MKRVLPAFERRNWLRSWRMSCLLHAIIFSVCLVQAFWFPLPQFQNGQEHAFIAKWSDEEPIELVMEVDATFTAQNSLLQEIPFDQLNLNDPRWQEILQEPLNEPVEQPAESLLVNEQLQQWIARSNQQTQQANLEQLASLSEKLEANSSQQGVDDVSKTLTRLLGTTERATQPQAAATGEFDFSTGQLHDVREVIKPDGSIEYVAIMLDAAGRTTEIVMPAAEGEQAFRTMQLVKSNPLLERVYRGVVMGIIDKMLQTK